LLCLLACGARPVERPIQDGGDTKLEPARAYVASVVRRIGMPDAHVRAHFTIPVVDSGPRPARLVIMPRSLDKPAQRIEFSVSSGSSRGPPRS
jgi:hypothetical protein